MLEDKNKDDIFPNVNMLKDLNLFVYHIAKYENLSVSQLSPAYKIHLLQKKLDPFIFNKILDLTDPTFEDGVAYIKKKNSIKFSSSMVVNRSKHPFQPDRIKLKYHVNFAGKEDILQTNVTAIGKRIILTETYPDLIARNLDM